MVVPDESFFTTLGKIESITEEDGKYVVVQNALKETSFGQCSRSSLWFYIWCKGQLINDICNVAVDDLPKLREEGCVMGNKFRLSVDPAAVVCQMKAIFYEYVNDKHPVSYLKNNSSSSW